MTTQTNEEYAAQFVSEIENWAKLREEPFTINQCKNKFEKVSKVYLEIACDMLVESKKLLKVIDRRSTTQYTLVTTNDTQQSLMSTETIQQYDATFENEEVGEKFSLEELELVGRGEMAIPLTLDRRFDLVDAVYQSRDIELQGKAERDFFTSLQSKQRTELSDLIRDCGAALRIRTNFSHRLNVCRSRASLLDLLHKSLYGFFSDEELGFVVSRYRTRESLAMDSSIGSSSYKGGEMKISQLSISMLPADSEYKFPTLFLDLEEVAKLVCRKLYHNDSSRLEGFLEKEIPVLKQFRKALYELSGINILEPKLSPSAIQEEQMFTPIFMLYFNGLMDEVLGSVESRDLRLFPMIKNNSYILRYPDFPIFDAEELRTVTLLGGTDVVIVSSGEIRRKEEEVSKKSLSLKREELDGIRWKVSQAHIELKSPYKNLFSYQSTALKAKSQWFGESVLLSKYSSRKHIISLLTDMFFVYYGIFYRKTFYTTNSYLDEKDVILIYLLSLCSCDGTELESLVSKESPIDVTCKEDTATDKNGKNTSSKSKGDSAKGSKSSKTETNRTLKQNKNGTQRRTALEPLSESALNQRWNKQPKQKEKKVSRVVEHQPVININYDSEEEEAESRAAWAHIARLGEIINGLPYLTEEDLAKHNKQKQL